MENKKRRVALSITGSLLDEFRTVSKEMGLTSSIMSTICEDALVKTLEIFKLAQKKGNLTIADLFHMIGEEVESIENKKREGEKDVTTGLRNAPRKEKKQAK